MIKIPVNDYKLFKDGAKNKLSMKRIIQEKHRNSKEEVAHDLYGYFGKDDLEKLQKISFEYLIDAEWTWSSIFRFQGREKNEWSNIIITYCLVIEHELVFHFQSMLNEFRELQGNSSAEVTLGSAVWALLNKNKSAKFSCAVTKSKLYLLSENKNLLIKLRNFAKQYRNKASHVTPISDINIVEFRKEFFDGGLLKNLLDSL